MVLMAPIGQISMQSRQRVHASLIRLIFFGVGINA